MLFLFLLYYKVLMNFLSLPQSFKETWAGRQRRSMGDHSERVHKRLGTMDTESNAEQGLAQPQAQVEDGSPFEHIKQGSEPYDAQAYGICDWGPLLAHQTLWRLC